MISTPFYKIVYLNPQTIPDILQIKPSRCLFAVGYLKPYQIPDACRCKNLLFVIGSKDSLDTHEVHR